MANNSEFIKSRNVSEGLKRPALNIGINVDAANALKGLKAIQREAKEATRALKELENVQSGTSLDEKGSYYIAIPRTLWKHGEEFGVWGIVRGENGLYTYPTVNKAKEFAETLTDQDHRPILTYYIIEIKG